MVQVNASLVASTLRSPQYALHPHFHLGLLLPPYPKTLPPEPTCPAQRPEEECQGIVPPPPLHIQVAGRRARLALQGSEVTDCLRQVVEVLAEDLDEKAAGEERGERKG